MHDEGEILRVDAPDEAVELADFAFGVRRVAEHAEGEPPFGQRRELRAAGQQKKQRERQMRKMGTVPI